MAFPLLFLQASLTALITCSTAWLLLRLRSVAGPGLARGAVHGYWQMWQAP